MSSSKRQRVARPGIPRKGSKSEDRPATAPVSLPLPEAGLPSPAAIPPAKVATSNFNPTPEEQLALERLPKCTRCGVRFLRRRDTCSVCGEWHPDKLAIPEHLRVSDDSPIRVTALKIYAMEQAGVTRDEIAKALGLSVKTIPGYLYKAGANGWLTFTDPKDTLEYQILHKAVRNLDELLDVPDLATKTEVTLKALDGMVWRKQDLGPQNTQQSIVAVKVEVVNGGVTAVREGTVMGAGKYLEAEVLPKGE